MPRVATPKDSEYSTTGAFKLGTLRITNGSPDSIPAGFDDEAGGAKPAVPCTDYFTSVPPRAEGVTSEPKAGLVQASMLSTGHHNSDVTPIEIPMPGPSSSGKANVPSLSVTVPAAGPGSQYLSSGSQPSPVEIEEQPLTRSSLEFQTKHTAAEDQLFDMEDDNQPEISAIEKLDVRLDPSAKGLPPQPLDDPTQPGVHGVKRTDSGFVSNSVSVSSTSHSSLTKADSGYSSSVSLRSFRSGKKILTTEKDTGRGSAESVRSPPEVTDKVPRHALDIQDSTSILTGDSPGPRTPESGKAPTPPPKDLISPKKAGQSPPLNVNGGDARAKLMGSRRARRKSMRQQLPNIDISPDGDRNLGMAKSVSPTPASAKSDSSESTSSLSIGSSSQKHGRLHRLLSLRSSGFSRAPLTVHVTHAVDEQVPSVPKDVEEKLREHTGRFPVTTKRLALRSQMSKETLKTILSVGSLEFAMEDEVSPNPVFFETDSDNEKTHHASSDATEKSLRQTINSMQSNFKQAAVSMMPNRKPILQQPIPASKGLQEAEIKHFAENDGSTGLRGNAYDVTPQTLMETQAQPARHAGRSMTLTAAQSNRLQLRTYSLNSMPSSPSNGLLSPSSPNPRVVSPPKKQKSPPPVSIATQSFRAPSVRSPVSPQGPAVLRRKSREGMHSSTNDSTAMPPVPTLSHRRMSVSDSNYRAADWDPYSHQNSLGSQMSSLLSSSHNPLSSVQSDLVYRPARAQPSCQHPNDPVPRQESNLNGFDLNQLQAVSVPYSPHQGPRTRSMSHSDPWNPLETSKLVEGHQWHPWDQQGPYPHHMSRGQHHRNLSTETHNPPYRILHSYNSPAYRNAPIWG